MVRKRLIAFFAAAAMVFSLLPAAVCAADDSSSSGEVSAGTTYTVPVDVEDSVNGQDFGAVVSDTALAVINSDGSVTYTLSFEPVTVMSNWQGWVSGFYGYYDGETLVEDFSVSYTTVIDETGAEQTAVDTVTFTAQMSDSYVLSYYLSSNVMSFTREKTMTVDWDNAVEGIAEEESEPVTYTGTATVDGYYYELSVSVTVLDGVICALEVTSEEVYAGEHDGSVIYYEDAAETLEESLIGVSATQSALESVDAVSGATMTSDAIIEAILSALGLADYNDPLDIELEAGAVYSVEITYKAAAHSLVSDPEATADDGTDTVTAYIVVDTGGQAAIVIELYNSDAMYITSYNGLHLGGTSDGEFSTENAVVYTAENEELEGGTYVTEVTIPIDNLYGTYYTSVSVYVPDMYNVDMDGDGEIDEGYFTVDPSTLTVDWDTLTQISYSEDGTDDSEGDSGDDDADDSSYDYTLDTALGFHTVSAEYTGTGSFEGMDRLLYAVSRYFGYRVGVEECEDGTWNVILYFGGEVGYNSAIGDITVYESADMTDEGTVYSYGEDLTYVINVASLDDPVYCGLYVGGSMDMTVTYAITVNADDYQGHSYTASESEDGTEITYVCAVCGDTYTEIVPADKTEDGEDTESEDTEGGKTQEDESLPEIPDDGTAEDGTGAEDAEGESAGDEETTGGDTEGGETQEDESLPEIPDDGTAGDETGDEDAEGEDTEGEYTEGGETQEDEALPEIPDNGTAEDGTGDEDNAEEDLEGGESEALSEIPDDGTAEDETGDEDAEGEDTGGEGESTEGEETTGDAEDTGASDDDTGLSDDDSSAADVGDSSDMTLWMGLLALAATAIICASAGRRKFS